MSRYPSCSPAPLGTAAASIAGEVTPTAGTSVVLQLEATGIERTATVTRNDPTAGRADPVFDTLSLIPI